MALRRGHLECGANCWPDAVTSSQHVYEVRPRKDKRGVNLISDALPFGRLRYGEPNAINNAVNCAGGERFKKASKSLDKRKD
jgi:hypothetical protein